jgi:magnesium transporter
VWRAGKPQDDFDFPSISDYLAEDDALVWCDIYDPDHAILKDLAQELSLNTCADGSATASSTRSPRTPFCTRRVTRRTHRSRGPTD